MDIILKVFINSGNSKRRIIGFSHTCSPVSASTSWQPKALHLQDICETFFQNSFIVDCSGQAADNGG